MIFIFVITHQKSIMNYDLVIIGGGPAGVGAGVYASRKHLKTVLITNEWGGQSTVSDDIQNWIGTISLSGAELATKLKEHLSAYAEDIVTIVEGECVERVEKVDGGFKVKTNKGNEFNSKTVFIGSGAHRKKLEVPGAAEFDQKGLTYCASCDGLLFKDMDVVVIGGGNAGFETAAQLLAYTKSVTLLNRGPEFKADPVTVKKVLENPKMKAILNAVTLEIKGDKFVTGLTYKDKDSEEKHELVAKGIFVEIGLVPTTGFVKDLVKLDDYGRIEIDPRNQKTSVEGVWAAGDSTNELYHQNNIAAGDAVKALEDIYNHLRAR
ncbi:FAD-dependent oxidoreductase [Patescibacteria group bacterium]|nr:FAD-dependent oxidoreductase [Patescibacteria group bacterium]